MSLCSPLLGLETPNDAQSVVWHSYNIQGTSKGSDQTVRMRRLIWAVLVAHTTLSEISCHGLITLLWKHNTCFTYQKKQRKTHTVKTLSSKDFKWWENYFGMTYCCNGVRTMFKKTDKRPDAGSFLITWNVRPHYLLSAITIVSMQPQSTSLCNFICSVIIRGFLCRVTTLLLTIT